MLKNKIVSKLFDTINKLSVSSDDIKEEEDEAIQEGPIEAIETKEYIVSIPNESKLLKFATEKQLLICIYTVRTEGLYPFILYLLHKATNEEVNFISLKCSAATGSKKIKYAVQAYLRSALPGLAFTYAGFCETPANNIIIYSVEQNATMVLTLNTDYIWATAYEVFNKKKVREYTLHKSITSFFCLNSDFLRLKTQEKRIYESPLVGYYISNDTCAHSEMDIYRETIIPALGKCYYLFMDMPHPHSPKLAEKANILRIAFFAGRMSLYTDTISATHYDSIFCRDYKRYIIQNYNQHVVLF
jgi:hypothetical protein